MENPERDTNDHEDTDHGITVHGTTEHENAEHVNTEGPEEGDDSLLLYVYEHNAGQATLTLELQDQNAPKMQLGRNRSVDVLARKEGAKAFHIDYYTFKYGYTLRLNNCGYTTRFKGPPIEGNLYGGQGTTSSWATFPWKEFHMHLPDDRWHAQLKHGRPGRYSSRAQGTHYEDCAEHNVVVFPKFMDKLEEIVGEGRIRLCKRMDGELVDIDAEDEAEGEEGGESIGEDGDGEDGMEGGDGGSE
ncbi:hypothetical protein J4E86_010984 [Alternaria arbusti]|uniref:uncharacterized protein n=1 Tax=Alternaria arbusti TaxID=232088 RepID=UPI00221EBF97|nr:uncharacterized protein J4E86_010984 [Alternaria arbusti]KAI4940350.1 hypothetical protein J4E86_010984 [Alternaria arbusti]